MTALVVTIDEHRAAFEYDWRTRFGLALDRVGSAAMSWGEAYRLTKLLVNDPGSQVAAALNGWPWPISREGVVALDLYDLSATWANRGKRQKPHPLRPKAERTTERRGVKPGVSQDVVIAALRAAGHTKALPGQAEQEQPLEPAEA